MAEADEQDAAPPARGNGQGEESGHQEEDDAMDDDAPQLSTLPLGQRIPLQHIIAHQVSEKHGDDHCPSTAAGLSLANGTHSRLTTIILRPTRRAVS